MFHFCFKFSLHVLIFQTEIEDALHKVCSLLPDSVKSDCADFIDKYTPKILVILSEELNAKLICGKLGLCPAMKVKLLNLNEKRSIHL